MSRDKKKKTTNIQNKDKEINNKVNNKVTETIVNVIVNKKVIESRINVIS